MCEIPEVCADYSAYAVGDGTVLVVEHFDGAISVDDVVAVVSRGFVAVGGALATVGIDDVATEGFLYFGAIDEGEGGAGGHDVAWTEGVSGMVVAILGQQVERDGVGADDGGT